jgi:hypothetical protein
MCELCAMDGCDHDVIRREKVIASDLARLRRRVRILESRLAKVLEAAETDWMPRASYGRVWSKHRRAK